MKTMPKLIVYVLALAITVTMPVMAAGKQSGRQSTQTNTSSLSQAEEETLLWMREEEKVARDVYLSLYKTWKQNVFSNIADSEQNHMDAVLKKIEMFGLIDPVIPGVGNFNNSTLQELFYNLVDEGNQSYVKALIVGATIEDMDILDLMNAIEQTNNLSLKTTYESLLEGSKNHLRAFVGLLRKQGEDYERQYISQELFDAILAL